MFTTPLVFWMGALLIILVECGRVGCVSTTVRFHEFTALGEFVCPAEHVESEAKVSSKAGCLLRCVATPMCQSIGFEEYMYTFRCIKCSTGEFLENVAGNSGAAIVYERRVSERQGDGDLIFGNFSYSVVLEEYTWDDAKIHCENMGGYLTSIKSNDEQEFLVNSIPVDYTGGFWIGGRGTTGVIDSFKWLDGTYLSDGYSNWDMTEFSNSTANDCIKVMRLLDFKWKNRRCGQTSASFCKFG